MTKKTQDPVVNAPTADELNQALQQKTQEAEQLRAQLQATNEQLLRVKANSFDLVMMQQEQSRSMNEVQQIFSSLSDLVGAPRGENGAIDVRAVMSKIEQKFAA